MYVAQGWSQERVLAKLITTNFGSIKVAMFV